MSCQKVNSRRCERDCDRHRSPVCVTVAAMPRYRTGDVTQHWRHIEGVEQDGGGNGERSADTELLQGIPSIHRAKTSGRRHPRARLAGVPRYTPPPRIDTSIGARSDPGWPVRARGSR